MIEKITLCLLLLLTVEAMRNLYCQYHVNSIRKFLSKKTGLENILSLNPLKMHTYMHRKYGENTQLNIFLYQYTNNTRLLFLTCLLFYNGLLINFFYKKRTCSIQVSICPLFIYQININNQAQYKYEERNNNGYKINSD